MKTLIQFVRGVAIVAFLLLGTTPVAAEEHTCVTWNLPNEPEVTCTACSGGGCWTLICTGGGQKYANGGCAET